LSYVLQTFAQIVFSTTHTSLYLQTVSVDHDSVVARPTFARTVQINQLPLPEGLQATLPSTIDAKGAVVAKVVHPAFKKGDDGLAPPPGTAGAAELTGSFLQGELGETSNPSVHSRSRQQQNRIVEIDVQGKGGRNGGGLSSGVASPTGFNRSQMSAAGGVEPRTGELGLVSW
jgi:hypothetical protein